MTWRSDGKYKVKGHSDYSKSIHTYNTHNARVNSIKIRGEYAQCSLVCMAADQIAQGAASEDVELGQQAHVQVPVELLSLHWG